MTRHLYRQCWPGPVVSGFLTTIALAKVVSRTDDSPNQNRPERGACPRMSANSPSRCSAKSRVTGDASAPAGAAPFADTRLRPMRLCSVVSGFLTTVALAKVVRPADRRGAALKGCATGTLMSIVSRQLLNCVSR